ncbi:hypothetical protein GCM10009750_26880 [Agromyces salentinus]|uniref:Uncharacterized protein n=1 Tax=Agromyces salentinus TaxID=269421 RepID=A0ABN2MUX2_9MICO
MGVTDDRTAGRGADDEVHRRSSRARAGSEEHDMSSPDIDPASTHIPAIESVDITAYLPNPEDEPSA